MIRDLWGDDMVMGYSLFKALSCRRAKRPVNPDEKRFAIFKTKCMDADVKCSDVVLDAFDNLSDSWCSYMFHCLYPPLEFIGSRHWLSNYCSRKAETKEVRDSPVKSVSFQILDLIAGRDIPGGVSPEAEAKYREMVKEGKNG